MKTINYFDLGLAKDSTMIDKIIEAIKKDNYKLNIFAFEATYEFYLYNYEKYKDYNNVNIYYNAVSDIDDENIKIYKWGNGYGNTIYLDYKAKAGKPCENNFEIVKSITLSKFIKLNNIDLDNSCNIIKMNIEGAEYNVMKDLIDNNLINKFNLYLTISYFKDVEKINKKLDFEIMMKPFNINHYCYTNKNLAIEEILKII